jgi:hypothetical protein
MDEVVKTILAMPPPKKMDGKKATTPAQEEAIKPLPKSQPAAEPKDEDRIDFVNVKDLIKGMERQKNKEVKAVDAKETNGFHKKIIDNGHDGFMDKAKVTEELEAEKNEINESEKTENTEIIIEKTGKTIDKADSTESNESCISRSNSLINGIPAQAPKPLPRSSISEPGSGEEHSEAPKPKPRTTAVPISGYKVSWCA